MLSITLAALFERDLKKVIQELELYTDEFNIWRTAPGISNSAGNLSLHLVGNLSTYVGREIGKINYVRNRELEFSLKDMPRAELVAKLDGTISIVKSSLIMLAAEDYEKEYPMLVLSEVTTTQYFILHLLSHLNYHLGQINYHRRMIEKGI